MKQLPSLRLVIVVALAASTLVVAEILDTEPPVYGLEASAVLQLNTLDVSDGAPASAVALSVTAVSALADGYLTAFPCGVEVPPTSSVNFTKHNTTTSHVIATANTDGDVCLRTTASVDVVVDAMGFFPRTGSWTFVTPRRVVDTRGQLGAQRRLSAGAVTPLRIGGSNGVPQNAQTVAFTLTTVNPSGPGFVKVVECAGSGDPTSTIDIDQWLESQAILADLADQSLCIVSTTDIDVIIDVNGWTLDAGSFERRSRRLVDTRLDDRGIRGAVLPGSACRILPPIQRRCSRA